MCHPCINRGGYGAVSVPQFVPVATHSIVTKRTLPIDLHYKGVVSRTPGSSNNVNDYSL